MSRNKARRNKRCCEEAMVSGAREFCLETKEIKVDKEFFLFFPIICFAQQSARELGSAITAILFSQDEACLSTQNSDQHVSQMLSER